MEPYAVPLKEYQDAFHWGGDDAQFAVKFRKTSQDRVGYFHDGPKGANYEFSKFEEKVAYVFRKHLGFWDVQRGFGEGVIDCGGPATRIVIEAKLHNKQVQVDVVRGIANAWLGVPGEEGPFNEDGWSRCIVAAKGFQSGCDKVLGASKICLFKIGDDDGIGEKHKLVPVNELAKSRLVEWEAQGLKVWKKIWKADLQPRAAAAVAGGGGAAAASSAAAGEAASGAAAGAAMISDASSRKRKLAPYSCSKCKEAKRDPSGHTKAKCKL